MRRAFCNPNVVSNFTSSTGRIMRYVAEDQTMICDEGPLGGLRLLQGKASKLGISIKEIESITVEQKSQQIKGRFSSFSDTSLPIKCH